MTAVELDAALAAALLDRMAETNVRVVQGDAAALDLPDSRFTAATCFSVLHHVPTAEDQDRILAEILRVLRPGAGLFRDRCPGSRHDPPGPPRRHIRATPGGLRAPEAACTRIGYTDIDLEIGEYEIRFAARRPERPLPS